MLGEDRESLRQEQQTAMIKGQQEEDKTGSSR
jgi:hypothetical protein